MSRSLTIRKNQKKYHRPEDSKKNMTVKAMWDPGEIPGTENNINEN